VTVDADHDMGWRVHDIVVGLLAGTGAGLVVGVFLVARVMDSLAVMVVSVGIGAAIGITLLVRLGQGRSGITAPRIVAWVILLLTASFMYLLIDAIRDFN
jgi:hypothetical protein